MMKSRRSSILILTLACTSLALAGAGAYPDRRPVKVLIGFSPGGPPDTVLRQLAARLSDRLAVPVVVENRVGASGTIAASEVARAAPDGHTLLFGVAANLAVAPSTMRRPPYDPATAFTPIVEVARGPYLWLVRGDAPARTMSEFVAWTKRQPGQLNYASPGVGSVQHLATGLLALRTDMQLVHVPYQGNLYGALLGKQVDAMFESPSGALPYVADGRVRALAVTGARRLDALPDVPTMTEAGLPDLQVNSWWGFVGPAGMPRDVVDRLNREIADVLKEPAVKTLLARWTVEATPGTPEAFGAYMASEFARWRQIAAQSGIELN